jgi:preprotein translocase subunit Sec63
MSDDAEIDPYDLLALSTEATDQDIRTAYRKLSLKVHPDRVCVIHSSNPRSRSSRCLERTGITQKQVRHANANPRQE